MFWFNHRRIWYLHQWAMGSTVWLVNCLLLIWSRQASLYQWNGWKGLSSRSSARIKAINIWWRNGWRFHPFLLAQRTTHRTTINELGLPKISHYCWLRPICVAGILCFSVCLRNLSLEYVFVRPQLFRIEIVWDAPNELWNEEMCLLPWWIFTLQPVLLVSFVRDGMKICYFYVTTKECCVSEAESFGSEINVLIINAENDLLTAIHSSQSLWHIEKSSASLAKFVLVVLRGQKQMNERRCFCVRGNWHLPFLC